MSRNGILTKLRHNRPAGPPLPDIYASDVIAYPDRHAQFAQLIRTLGGEAKPLPPGGSVLQLVAEHWPQPGRCVDLTIAPHTEVATPHGWSDVDIAIVPGQLAVAENAAVWVSHPDNQFRSIYFLAQKLVLVVPGDAIVNTMRDAYAQLRCCEHGFGCFIAGSSRTADIEQSLVLGAHGAMDVLVVFS